MKRYLLFTITLIFWTQLVAQVLVTPANMDSVEIKDVLYDTDCDEEGEDDFTDFFATNNKREEPLRIYPNPTTEYISVTDNSSVDYLHVYNIIGRRVKSFPVYEGGQYSLRDLPDGMYLISMVDVAGHILKTVRTSKSVPRP